MYRRLFATLLLLVLLGMGVAAVSAQGDGEPILHIPYIAEGEVITRAFADGVYAHLYTFQGAMGDAVTIAMNRAGDSAVDPYLILLDANGTVLAVNDVGGAVVGNALIQEFVLPEDGMYLILATFADYILMSGYALDADVLAGTTVLDPLEYELSVEGIPSLDSNEPPALDLMATELAVGESITLEISPETPVAYATFVGEADQAVTIATQPTTDTVDTMLYLFTDAGDGIAFNDDEAAIAPYSAITDLELPQDGMYLILVTTYQFYAALGRDWDVAGEFGLSVE